LAAVRVQHQLKYLYLALLVGEQAVKHQVLLRVQ
jgi:hypothetical protein